MKTIGKLTGYFTDMWRDTHGLQMGPWKATLNVSGAKFVFEAEDWMRAAMRANKPVTVTFEMDEMTTTNPEGRTA